MGIHLNTLELNWACPCVRCDSLQQYPCKLFTKKLQNFLLIVSALHIIFFYLAN
jgi:hypothetical protein